MEFSVAYLVKRFFYRMYEFLRHWYVRSARMYSNFVVTRFEHLDRKLAWKVTLKNLFQPLYKDYTPVGYVLGFFFRSMRLIVASVIYVFLFFIAILVYFFWVALPIILFLSAMHF